MAKWMAILVADDKAQPFPANWLLGGVKVAKMGPYENKKDAEHVAQGAKETNEKAGRKVARAYVREYNPVNRSKERKAARHRRPRLTR